MSRSAWWSLLALAAVLAAMSFSLWNTPSAIVAPWDVFTLMDGGYRINQGQAPGSDFATPRWAMTTEETQGPYWFDVDDIRQDIREDRPGLQLDLALRVQDLAQCNADPAAGGIANAVVEIWHCDAGGEYSGFATAARGRDPATPPTRSTTRPGSAPPRCGRSARSRR